MKSYLQKKKYNALINFLDSPALRELTSFKKNIIFQAASRDREQTEIFRLGVQKCKKIIYDCVPSNQEIFKGDGIDILFKMLRNIYEGREIGITEKESMEK